jgi:hypothetical protein
MGRIIQKNNGKTSVFVTGEDITGLTPEAGTYFIGPDLNTGDYSIKNPEGDTFNLETNYITGGTYDNNTGTLEITGPNNSFSVSGFTTGGGSFEIIDVTYSELYGSIVNGLLIPGSWYRLTDYRSVNFLNGWEIAYRNPTPADPNFNPTEIYEGEVEVILLQAVSDNQLNPTAYSEKFSGDILEYQAYTNKIGVDFDIYNGQTLPDLSVVSGFDLQWDGINVYFEMPAGYPALFGHYFYLYCSFDNNSYYQDGAFEPLTPGVVECHHPYTSDDPDYGYPKAMSRIRIENGGMKVVLLDLDETDFNNYDVDSLYVDTVQALGDAYGWITRRNDTEREVNVPFDFRGRKYRRFEVNLSAINAALGTGYYGRGDNFYGQGTTGNYKDLSVFGLDFSNIQWEGIGGPDMYWYNGYSDNNVFGNYLYLLNIEDYFYNNTVGNSFQQNTVGNSFQQNTVGNFFYQNTVGNSFQQNTVGDSFYNNTVGNSFQQNTVGNNFQQNTVGNFFYQNTVGNFFQFNTVGDSFLFNTVGDNFRRNQIDYSLNSTNFSSATHVYGGYNCQIFQRSDGSLRLSFVDGNDVVQYTNINS